MRACRARIARLLLGAVIGCTGSVWAGTVAPGLDRALDEAGPDEFVPVVALMGDFPSRVDLMDDVRGLNRANRRRRVVSRLGRLAESSQRPVHALFEAYPARVRNVRVLWGINGVAFEATPEVVDRLGELQAVRRLFHDRATGHLETDLLDPHPGRTYGSQPSGAVELTGPNPDATVRGEVIAMGAQQVWDELGYTGAGVLVAVIDTGIDRDHADIAGRVWTNEGEIGSNGIDDDGNGYIDDTWGWDFCTGSNEPNGGQHGTQVAGQVAGNGTEGIVTGMAPNARLMALGIDCDTPSIGWEASDYAIAHGADLITQSYSWWWTDVPDYEAFRRQTDTELAAGVLHINSAGNGGTNPDRPLPYNISAPANAPAPWVHPDQTLVGGVSSILAVGNINWSNDLIASSSSLGPTAWEDIRANTDPGYPYVLPPEYLDYPWENGAQLGLIKPDLSAYGDGTTTICPGSGYCGFSGTSSAAPHVSGVAALMLQSNPEATPAELAEALMTTAEHRGDPGKNNVYGAGLVQAYPAVLAVESGVLYLSHTIDDSVEGNGDLKLDPGERVSMEVTIESRVDTPIDDLVAILSSATPGVTVHNSYVSFPVLPARGTATGNDPQFSLSIDPAACSTVIVFDLEMRYGAKVRRSTFEVRVGEPEILTLLDDDFESDLGWSVDPGTTTRGAWVREDPEGITGSGGSLTNPEDDTSDPGVTCWMTGNGRLSGQAGENNNDVDDGATRLTSPAFGDPYMLSLELRYDRWYYDDSSGGDSFRTEVSNDGGQSWFLIENIVISSGGWESETVDLLALLPATDDMRLRFTATDGSDDTVVEGAVDEVAVDGIWVNCQEWTPTQQQAPNTVGNTLTVDVEPGGHTRLAWQAPAVDAGHDAATLYRIQRAAAGNGSFVEVGSSTETAWVGVDALQAPGPFYYRVVAENSGGTE